MVKSEVKSNLESANFKLFCSLLFVTFVTLIIGIYYKNLVFKIQELSLFLFDKEFFTDCILHPGGFLDYAGYFLTQFFYYPALGGLILGSLLLLIQYLTYKIFDIPGKLYFLSFIPSALLLLSVTRLDYIIFMPRGHEYVYSQPLGMLFSLLLVYACNKSVSITIQSLSIAAITVVAYPLAGFYALFSVVIIILKLSVNNWNSIKKGLIIESIVLVAIIPFLYYRYFYERLSPSRIYTSGLILKGNYNDILSLWLPLVCALILCVLYSCFFRKQKSIRIYSPKKLYLNIIALAVILSGICLFSNHNESFRAVLSINRILETNDWKKIVEISKNIKQPDRMVIMYRNLALTKQMQLCNEMFNYPEGNKGDDKSHNVRSMNICGYHLLFYYGRINHAYRWAMESLIANGLKIDYLQYLIKTSLTNNENGLAKKYIATLGKTLFYKAKAKEYQSYIETPDLWKKTATYKSIDPFLTNEDVLGEECEYLEIYLLNYFRYILGGSFEMLEASMGAIMTLKASKDFWNKAMIYPKNKMKMPKHIQEAALLFAHIDKKTINTTELGIDPFIIKRFNQFTYTLKTCSENELKSVLKKSFGDTYWNYYFTTEKVQTN